MQSVNNLNLSRFGISVGNPTSTANRYWKIRVIQVSYNFFLIENEAQARFVKSF